MMASAVTGCENEKRASRCYCSRFVPAPAWKAGETKGWRARRSWNSNFANAPETLADATWPPRRSAGGSRRDVDDDEGDEYSSCSSSTVTIEVEVEVVSFSTSRSLVRSGQSDEMMRKQQVCLDLSITFERISSSTVSPCPLHGETSDPRPTINNLIHMPVPGIDDALELNPASICGLCGQKRPQKPWFSWSLGRLIPWRPHSGSSRALSFILIMRLNTELTATSYTSQYHDGSIRFLAQAHNMNGLMVMLMRCLSASPNRFVGTWECLDIHVPTMLARSRRCSDGNSVRHA
nr:hypothetical protein CFP56_37314 [Quercus suber]